MWSDKSRSRDHGSAGLASIIVFLALLGTGPALARACAHGFDSIFPVDDGYVLHAPTADFDACLERAGLRARPLKDTAGRSRRPIPRSDLEAEIEDLRQSLPTVPADRREAIVQRYAAFRKTLRLVQEKRRDGPPGPPNAPDPWPADVPREPPAGLGREFSLYLRGAVAYTNGQPDKARREWQRLLALPQDQRKYRSVWAAYMIGRTYGQGSVSADPDEAAAWMRKTRELAEAGFSDSQGLAEASLGWEARAELDRGNFERSIALYWQLGDTSSLADAAHAIFKAGKPALRRMARDPLATKVLTALVISRGGPWRPQVPPDQIAAWLEAVERSGQKDLAGADQLAWGAYQSGDIAAARRWLARARPESLLARWLASKLLLREGKIDESAAILAGLVRDWPVNDEWNGHWESPIYPADRIAGELGMLRLVRGKYIEAMDLLLRRCFFDEAAYIAERVLTADEFKAYVDQHWPENAPAPRDGKNTATPDYRAGQRGIPADLVPESIRYLLGRRLVRLGRWPEAREYLPPPWRDRLDEYVGAIRASADPVLCDDERGERLWHAARIARKHGMELMGTQGEPDNFSSGGLFGIDPKVVGAAPTRLAWIDGPLLRASEDEARRARQHHPEPDRRYHYRYIAAEHAWNAAQMLADESDLKARVLCTAGNWLAPQDPASARRFYRALVETCGTTRLGRDARKLKWLPPSPP